jgi:hypothetical protein
MIDTNLQSTLFLLTVFYFSGEITATCASHRIGARVSVQQNEAHHYTLRVLPTTADKHLLQIKYDGLSVPGRLID